MDSQSAVLCLKYSKHISVYLNPTFPIHWYEKAAKTREKKSNCVVCGHLLIFYQKNMSYIYIYIYERDMYMFIYRPWFSPTMRPVLCALQLLDAQCSHLNTDPVSVPPGHSSSLSWPPDGRSTFLTKSGLKSLPFPQHSYFCQEHFTYPSPRPTPNCWCAFKF